MTDTENNSFDAFFDREGIKAIMDRFSNDLFLFVRGIVGNNESAEEIVSDVFFKIWQKRAEFYNIKNIKSFLFILARNESISFLRKKRKIKILSLDEVKEYSFAPLESDGIEPFDQEIIDKINVAIEQLPPKCKMAFSLAKINGLKYKEIAKLMEISPLTVKNHIVYALEKICTEVGVSQKDSKISFNDIYLLFLSLRQLSVKCLT